MRGCPEPEWRFLDSMFISMIFHRLVMHFMTGFDAVCTFILLFLVGKMPFVSLGTWSLSADFVRFGLLSITVGNDGSQRLVRPSPRYELPLARNPLSCARIGFWASEAKVFLRRWAPRPRVFLVCPSPRK